MTGEESSLEHVKALLGLTCAAIEQVTLDSGSWTMAHQFMCLPEPPLGYISRAPTGQPWILFTDLADPRWSAAIMGYLKDVDSQRAQRRTSQREDDQPPPKRPPKGAGREAELKVGGRGAGRPGSDHLFLVDQQGTHYIDCQDVELPFGRQLVHDIRHRTQTAMDQAHAFRAMELALTAQARAARLGHLAAPATA
jgi:hypothetical protein